MTLPSGAFAGASSQVSDARVSEALEEILSRPEFRKEPGVMESIMTEIVEWIVGFIDSLGIEVERSQVESWAEGLWIAVAVVSGALLIWFWISVTRSRQARPTSEALPLSAEVAERVSALRAQAREAQGEGDLTRALRLYFFALVVGLGERGELDYNDAWTNRELLERGEPEDAILQLLRPLVGELDEHSFGRRPTNPSEVQRFAGLCEDLLGAGASR